MTLVLYSLCVGRYLILFFSLTLSLPLSFFSFPYSIPSFFFSVVCFYLHYVCVSSRPASCSFLPLYLFFLRSSSDLYLFPTGTSPLSSFFFFICLFFFSSSLSLISFSSPRLSLSICIKIYMIKNFIKRRRVEREGGILFSAQRGGARRGPADGTAGGDRCGPRARAGGGLTGCSYFIYLTQNRYCGLTGGGGGEKNNGGWWWRMGGLLGRGPLRVVVMGRAARRRAGARQAGGVAMAEVGCR